MFLRRAGKSGAALVNLTVKGNIMGQVVHYMPRGLNKSIQTTDLAKDLWSIAKRVLAVLAVVAVSYGVFSVDVELVKDGQITEAYPR